jgi:hypothetical protein
VCAVGKRPPKFGTLLGGNHASRLPQPNRYFPERTIYPFDTFAGFDARDLTVEAARGRGGVPMG